MAKRRRSAFVPRVIFSTVFVGVVPAVAACGGDDSGGGQSGTTVRGVAAGGFAGVGVGGFAGVGVGGFGAVAEMGFGGSAGTSDAASDAASRDGSDAASRGGAGGQDGGRDAAIFGVAAGGFAVAQQAFAVPASRARK